MHSKNSLSHHTTSQHHNITTWILLCLFALSSCASPPLSQPPKASQALLADGGFNKKSIQAGDPPPAQLERVSSVPANPAYELRFQTGQAVANTIRMPDGPFKVSIEVGPTNVILDADAVTDGLARIQVTAATAYDLYLRPEQASVPTICQGTGSNAAVLDQIDQLVQDKANALIAAGKSQCAYLPPANQRQNANCNSTSSGLSCSGALNKTLLTAQCPEMAIYAGAVNLNNDLTASKLFVATSNNLTLNQSAKGILSSRGNLNTNLNGNRQLEGVFVGGSSNNLNLSGTPTLKGLYHIANNASLAFNMNGNATFEGALCSTGSVNFNRNGNTKVIYHPNVLDAWVNDVANLAGMSCDARPNFYTQNIAKTCPAPTPPATLGFSDPLYVINQTLVPIADGSWYKMPGRPLPVPADWYSADGQKYVLTLDNHGMAAMTERWFSQNNSVTFPSTVKVIPTVDCVQRNVQGNYTAFLSYTNLMAGSVLLPVGANNHFSPSTANPSQLTHFEAGQSSTYPTSPARVNFSSEELTWTLGARSVTIQAQSPSLQCPQLKINDVLLSENGQSVMGPNPPVAIQSQYEEKHFIQLTLQGSFSPAIPLNEPSMRFTFEPGLLHQTFAGNEPSVRVLLDDAIILEPTEVSPNQIKVRLNSQYLPDLYLKGAHTLTLIAGSLTQQVEVMVEPLFTAQDLKPVIQSWQVIEGQPRFLKITGRNFMVNPHWQEIKINSLILPVVSVSVLHAQTFLLWAQLDSTTLLPAGATLSCETPFGTALKRL